MWENGRKPWIWLKIVNSCILYRMQILDKSKKILESGWTMGYHEYGWPKENLKIQYHQQNTESL